MAERLEIRIYGDESLPTLVYLPGLHGDWTLVSGFRCAISPRVRFVEVTYPRTLTWSLDDYAAAVETALAENKITGGWLLGESYSSQVVWPMVARGKFQIDGIVLAGGFVRHPMRWAARWLEAVLGRIPFSMIVAILFGYAKVARFRFRHSAATLATIQEFIDRRTELDRQAAVHRLHLIAQNDPRPIARTTSVPVFGLTGVLDPIVPWIFVRPWLRRHCPALRDYKIIWHADHTVLATTPNTAAEIVLNWMGSVKREA
jgi:pimeloyl-ACP methyl ester carboxylesterase